MAVSLLLTAVLFGLPVLRFQTYHQDGVLRGLAGIAYEKKQYADLSVLLTDEYIADSIREVQELFEDPENVGYDGNEQFLIGDAYWKEIAPRESLLDMIVRNYADPNVSVGYSAMTDLDVSDGTDFYQARQDKIEKILNDASKELSDEEKAYWREMNSKVREPFRYGYYGGWEVLISAFELLMFPILAVCIVLAPVFSGRISGRHGCGYPVREIRKDQTGYGEACGCAAVRGNGFYASCDDRVRNSACGVRSRWMESSSADQRNDGSIPAYFSGRNSRQSGRDLPGPYRNDRPDTFSVSKNEESVSGSDRSHACSVSPDVSFRQRDGRNL